MSLVYENWLTVNVTHLKTDGLMGVWSKLNLGINYPFHDVRFSTVCLYKMIALHAILSNRVDFIPEISKRCQKYDQYTDLLGGYC